MRPLFLAAAAVAFLSACQDETPSAEALVSPEGTAFTLITLPGNEDVSVHVAWATDWAYREGTAKAAPYVGTELILAGGAEGFAAGEVAELFADLNSEGMLYVGVSDHIIGELTFERAEMDRTVDIANAHLRAPSLDETWFARINDGFGQNIAEARATAAHAGFETVRWAVFGEAPLRNALSLDDPGVFDRLTQSAVADWHAETFTRNPEAIVVAGDISTDAAGEMVDALLFGLPAGEAQVSREAEPDFSHKRILLVDPDTDVTNLAFVAPVPPTSEGGEFEDLILAHALGGDDQSVLFDVVRAELRASYSFGAGITNYTRDHRILIMSGEVEDAKLADAETAVLNAYKAFKEDPLSGDLADYKAPLAENLSELSGYVVDQAQSELQGLLDGYDVGRSLDMMAELDAVTDTSLMERLTGDFPAAEDFIVIAVSPSADALPGACVITAPEQAIDCP